MQMHGKLLHHSHHLAPVEIALPEIPLWSFSNIECVCSCAPPPEHGETCTAPAAPSKLSRKFLYKVSWSEAAWGASALACSVRRHRSGRTLLCHRCGSPPLVAYASGSSKDCSIFGKLCAAFNTARRVWSSSSWASTSKSSSTSNMPELSRAAGGPLDERPQLLSVETREM